MDAKRFIFLEGYSWGGGLKRLRQLCRFLFFYTQLDAVENGSGGSHICSGSTSTSTSTSSSGSVLVLVLVLVVVY